MMEKYLFLSNWHVHVFVCSNLLSATQTHFVSTTILLYYRILLIGTHEICLKGAITLGFDIEFDGTV